MKDINDQTAINEINAASFRIGELYGVLMKHRDTHPELVDEVYRKMLMYMPMEQVLIMLDVLGETMRGVAASEDKES